MTFKKHLTLILISLLLTGTSAPTLAMDDWGIANDDDNEQARQAAIRQQLEQLEPLGVKLKDNILNIPLREANQVDLALGLAGSHELLNHYDVHLDYESPLVQGHVGLFRRFPNLVSLKIHYQTLDVARGTTLNTLLGQHPTLTVLDFSHSQGFKLTDDGLIAIQLSMNALPHLKNLTLRGQNNLSNNGFITLSNILPNIVFLEELDLSEINLGPTGENQILNQLSKLTNLTKLDVSNNKLEGDFLSALKALPNLTEINLSRNKITRKKFISLVKCKSKKKLKTLNVSSNKIDDESLIVISTLPNITTLNINDNKDITGEEIKNLVDLKNLTNLSIGESVQISADTLLLLARKTLIKEIIPYYSLAFIKALRNDPSMTSLSLANSLLGAAGAEVLAKNTTLTSLELPCKRIGDTGAQALAKNTTLTSLDLQYNKIGAAGAQALAKNTTLTSLNLYSNRVGDTGAQAFEDNTTLTSLNLYGNKIEETGAQALANNTTLTSLDLQFNEIGDTGAQALADNTTLTSLKLIHNNIGDTGAQALANNTTLTSLNLYGNKIGDSGAQAFEDNTTLTSLNLYGNKIGDTGAQALANNTTLTSLNLSYNNIGDIGKNALRNSPNPHLKSIFK